ncbi:MAG: prepilin-type N-terminal cleavage/methylation domain-containing protein [Acinetobacter sp.]
MQQVPYRKMQHRAHQQGITLIEVLVSIVMMAIIGLGAAYIAGRTAVIHRDQNIHLYTVNQFRQQLENTGQCSSKAVGTHTVQVDVAGSSVQAVCSVKKETFSVTARDGSGNQNNGVAAGTVYVTYADIQVSTADTSIVPIKVKISP